MKYSEVERKLKKYGCYCVDESGNHPKWYSPITDDFFSLSHHKSEEAKPKTLRNIAKASGIKF